MKRSSPAAPGQTRTPPPSSPAWKPGKPVPTCQHCHARLLANAVCPNCTRWELVGARKAVRL